MKNFYESTLFPLLEMFDPEKTHSLALWLLDQKKLVPFFREFGVWEHTSRAPALERKIAGITFPNPLGFATGLSKGGTGLRGLQELGFGFGTIGTVTPEPQDGNTRPRIFRLSNNKAVVNRMGFNSEGLNPVLLRVSDFRRSGEAQIPFGVSIGPNKSSLESGKIERAIMDYCKAFVFMSGIADFIEINVSSPNTKGLSSYQSAQYLESILCSLRNTAEIMQIESTPLAVKISPDFSELGIALKDIVSVCRNCGVSIITAVNTTTSRDGLNIYEQGMHESGGMSGAPLFEKSLRIVEEIRKCGWQGGLIGVGGISSGEDAKRMLEYADLVQVYTAFIYKGPKLIREVLETLWIHSIRRAGVSAV